MYITSWVALSDITLAFILIFPVSILVSKLGGEIERCQWLTVTSLWLEREQGSVDAILTSLFSEIRNIDKKSPVIIRKNLNIIVPFVLNVVSPSFLVN